VRFGNRIGRLRGYCVGYRSIKRGGTGDDAQARASGTRIEHQTPADGRTGPVGRRWNLRIIWELQHGPATRYDKLAVRYEATVHIAAINEWLLPDLLNRP
jgi:hypothetical protein